MSAIAPRRLTPYTSLDNLKKEAKRWLKAIRAGNDAARARFHAAHPDPRPTPTLRDVQLALAREFGLPGWTDLKLRITAEPVVAERIGAFLQMAALDWRVGSPDRLRAMHAAGRLLSRYPEIAQ